MKLFKKILLTAYVFNVLALLVIAIFNYGNTPEWFKWWALISIGGIFVLGLAALILFRIYLILVAIWEK